MKTLYLLPIPLAENALQVVLPQIKDLIQEIDYYFVENIRTARRFISSLQTGRRIEDLHFFELDKDTDAILLQKYVEQIPKEAAVGVMSEAGCPAVADPGALAVAYAQKQGIQVVPLVGASSILLGLMGAGFNGQQFAFLGYLPIDKQARCVSIKQLEKDMRQKNQTQIFIETPYRNNQLLADLCLQLSPETLLCVAANLTTEQEFLKTKTIGAWKKQLPDLHKQPAIFLVGK